MSHQKALSFGSALTFALLAALISQTAFAFHDEEHYSLFEDAAYTTPGHNSDRAVTVTSDSDPGYGGIEFGVEEGTTFADLETLSTDYLFADADSCEGGSPRFQIGLENATSGDSGNIFVYLGSEPNYNDCPDGVWTNTGDLIGSSSVDASQLDGGTFYNSYADALEDYGDYAVTELSLVADAGWAAEDGSQVVTFDNTQINSTIFTYEEPAPETPTSKDQCKNGGWMTLADGDGNLFKNQGQCVAYATQQGF
jgi:hypothetical protein